MKRATEGVEHIFLVFTFFTTFSMQMMGAYLIIWFRQLGFSYMAIGLITSVYMILSMGFDIPSSAFADKYGRMKVYSLGTAVFGIGLIFLSLSRAYHEVLISYAIMGVGLGIYSNVLPAWIVDFDPSSKEWLVRIFSRQQTINGIAGVAGSSLAGIIIILAHDLSIPVLLSGIIMLVIPVIALLAPDNRGSKTTNPPIIRVMREGMTYVAKNRPLLLILISTVITVFPVVAWMQYISPYVVDVLGLKKGYWGFLLSIYFLMTSMGGYLNEKLAKRFDYRLLAIISTTLLSLFVTFLALRNLIIVLILLVLVSIVYAMRASDIIAWENAIIGIEHRSTVLSTLSTIIKIMYIITPPIVGLLIDIASYGNMYLLIGLSSLLAVVFMVKAYVNKA